MSNKTIRYALVIQQILFLQIWLYAISFGWRGCIDNAKDQTERHFSELGERGTPPNNTTTRSEA